MIGLIVPVSLDVSSTGHIKIVGDQRHCEPKRLNPPYRWELQAVEWDIDKQKSKGSWFAVTESEVTEWLSKNSQQNRNVSQISVG